MVGLQEFNQGNSIPWLGAESTRLQAKEGGERFHSWSVKKKVWRMRTRIVPLGNSSGL